MLWPTTLDYQPFGMLICHLRLKQIIRTLYCAIHSRSSAAFCQPLVVKLVCSVQSASIRFYVANCTVLTTTIPPYAWILCLRSEDQIESQPEDSHCKWWCNAILNNCMSSKRFFLLYRKVCAHYGFWTGFDPTHVRAHDWHHYLENHANFGAEQINIDKISVRCL